VLRAFWPSNAWPDICQVELQQSAVLALLPSRNSKHALCLEVTSEGIHQVLRTSCRFQIITGFFVDRKEAHGRPILWSHVGNRRSIRNWQRGCSLSMEFHKFPNDLGSA